jgi:F-type H+-transporting ATPase subunit gamma
VKILTIGKKGREQLKRDFREQMIDHVDLSDVKRLGYNNAQDVASDIIKRFNADEFDIATLYFAEFQSVISQVPLAQQLIPAKFEVDADAEAPFYEYEPSEDEILSRSVAARPYNAGFHRLCWKTVRQSRALRMSAMDNATRNAGEMIDKLTIQYNRSRQAAITNELIEIISGAEAL